MRLFKCLCGILQTKRDWGSPKHKWLKNNQRKFNYLCKIQQQNRHQTIYGVYSRFWPTKCTYLRLRDLGRRRGDRGDLRPSSSPSFPLYSSGAGWYWWSLSCDEYWDWKHRFDTTINSMHIQNVTFQSSNLSILR